MASPVGRLGIEFHGAKVAAIVVQPSRSEAKHYKPIHKVKMTDFLLEALGRLSEYFVSVRQDPEIEVDLRAASLDEFSQRVFTEVQRIPYGRTWTYKRLAEASGLRDGHNLVRSVLSSNPIPILIPCHRVTPNKGGAGAWIAGTKKKEKLLRIERKGELAGIAVTHG
ncbi:MAG: methylated-DNA--[protein]-cysteine S-methyltransferase [Acidobacteriota bacterium]|nr:methylated-DNA--[protein]-cysteine S-methyltransferase [Acidobacteriota bacterium]